ncbi:hypothetical protein GJV44_00296 [Candidatus Vallotia cooleyia]|nr:hypothetical protein GJV44_00296 [Candidatus Vallotia cooleyia]
MFSILSVKLGFYLTGCCSLINLIQETIASYNVWPAALSVYAIADEARWCNVVDVSLVYPGYIIPIASVLRLCPNGDIKLLNKFEKQTHMSLRETNLRLHFATCLIILIYPKYNVSNSSSTHVCI